MDDKDGSQGGEGRHGDKHEVEPRHSARVRAKWSSYD
jgi:hypothetical protein